MRYASLSLALLFVTVPARAVVYNATPSDDIEAMVGALNAGDELILADGTYNIDERFTVTVTGTEAMPIIIRAADGASPLIQQNSGENIWDIQAEYLEIRGIRFTGGSAGLRFESGRFVTIEDCEIFETGDVALRMNDTGQLYESMHIVGNHIHDTHDTGEGMYLGCNENGCQLANTVIERNYIHNTDAADVTQGDGIEIKEGSYGNIVRDNVIHSTNYPCILTYGTVGMGAPNIIERNVLWGCGNHGIQSAADTIIRNNIILGANANGIAMQMHQNASPSNLVVVHNTIIEPNNHALSVSSASGSVVIANNALYAMGGRAIRISGPTGGIVVAGNVGEGGIEGIGAGGLAMGSLGADFVDARYNGGLPNDLYPAAGGGLVGAGDSAHGVSDDFNATDRAGTFDVGAYLFDSGGNPGWTIVMDFKGIGATPLPGRDAGVRPGRDGGVASDGGGTTDDGGCSCRAGVGAHSERGALFYAFGALFLLGRRRR